MLPSVDRHIYDKSRAAESLATTDTCTVKGVAVSEVEPAIDLRVAVIVVVPSVKVVARPVELTVATVALDELHVAEPETF